MTIKQKIISQTDKQLSFIQELVSSLESRKLFLFNPLSPLSATVPLTMDNQEEKNGDQNNNPDNCDPKQLTNSADTASARLRARVVFNHIRAAVRDGPFALKPNRTVVRGEWEKKSEVVNLPSDSQQKSLDNHD